MTTDIERQIHAYGTQLIDSQPPITATDVSDLLTKIRELPPAPVPARQKPRLWVAVGTAIAVLIAFGGFSLLLATNNSDTPLATDPTNVPVDGPVTSGGTYEDLPNESSIGWRWYETGLSTTAYSIWRLRDGSFVAYSKGWDREELQTDGSELYFVDGSTEPIADPVEQLLVSTDGTTWADIRIDRFDGFFTYAHSETVGDAPYFYVTAVALDADRSDTASWSTWATADGQTWFEVLIDNESAGTYFLDHEQIGRQVIAAAVDRLLVSSDGGRSFASIDQEVFGAISSEVFIYDGVFRVLAWNEDPFDAAPYTYVKNPVLWESSDGVNWTVIGPVSGLDPQQDGRGLIKKGLIKSSNRMVQSPGSGYLVLVGSEPTTVNVRNDRAMYVLESRDGGLTWQPLDNVPISPNRASGLLPTPTSVTTIDNWVVMSTGEVTLATDGDTWVRVDNPTGTLLKPIALRGAVLTDSYGPAWIALPDR